MSAAMTETRGNDEQIRYWNETAGPRWVKQQALLDAQIRDLGLLAMSAVPLAAGARVLDVGCGCGETTLELARRVQPGGEVLGVDVSAPMLVHARARAATSGAVGVAFEEADAQVASFPPGRFDVVFSRFGVMFFADPVAAFRNLRSATRPGGQLGFVCWQGLELNPWMRVPLAALASIVPLPAPPAPGAPGPLALADPERTRGILRDAGWAEVSLAATPARSTIGGPGADVDTAVFMLMQLGPAAAALREAPAEAQARAAVAIREAIAPYATPQGVVMDAGVWLVTATRAD